MNIKKLHRELQDGDTLKEPSCSGIISAGKRTGKYDIESLININGSYHHKHGVRQYDVDMANRYVALIEKTRSDTVPKAGDQLRYTDRYGGYHPYAHIEHNRDGKCYICERPYVPFIGQEEDGIWCSTSGGAWGDLKTNALKYVGKELKTFGDWGHCGACGNGAVHFIAEVSVWEYIHPEPLFEDYTTEKWRKMYVSKLEEEDRKEHSGYLYVAQEALPSGNSSDAFRTEEEYVRFLKNYKAKVFPGNWHNQSVVFCYRKELMRISQVEYDALNLPVTSIYCNGLCPAKIRHDDENKTVINYFV